LILDAFGKLYNDGGELVAEGNCQVDVERGTVTLRPIIDTPLLSRQEGLLRLVLEDGTEFSLSHNAIRFRLNVPGVPPGPAYRLSFAGHSSAEGRAAGGSQ
jgi:hypothetical protein